MSDRCWRTALLASGLGLIFGLVAGAAETESTGVTAVSWQPVHPILIRNEHGPLTRVVINVPKGQATQVRSLTFSLAGTDHLDDADALSLFFTQEKLDFSTTVPVGAGVSPAATITFRDDRELKPGRNVFWLTCRLKPTAGLLRHVAATCTAIETAAGTITPQDASPGGRHRIGVAVRRPNDDGVHTSRIPALTTSAKGTLLCVYDLRRREGRDLQEDIDIGLSRSTDGGQSWEPVRVIMDMGEFGGLPQSQNGCSDPGIIVDHQTGEIFCFAVWMNGKPGKHQWTADGSEPGFEIGKSAQLLMVRSKDDGLTWSKPENLTRQLKKEAWWLFAPAPQSGIQLADGTLVMPAQGRNEQGEEFSTIMTSRDHGTTWTVGTPATDRTSECQVAPLGDGSLMLNMRNEKERFRAVCITRDLGQTWEPHATHRNTLIEPNCNGSLIRVDFQADGTKKHVLLFANPHNQMGRSHHTVQVSFDDGMTWPESHQVLLDTGRGAGYPSLTRVDDQHIGLVYEGSQAHVIFEKFRLSDLLKPSAPTPAVTLGKQRVGKILFLGNSITLHGPAPHIGWTGNWGMAASAPQRDYVHRLADRIAAAVGCRPQVMVKNIADFERQLGEYNLTTGLKAELAFQPELIIVAIGENAAALTTDESKSHYRTAFAKLLAALKHQGNPTIVVRSCFWANPEKDGLMKSACEEAGGVFVDQSSLGADEAHFARSERKIEHAGVAGHPGDKGMQAIAESLWQAIERHVKGPVRP